MADHGYRDDASAESDKAMSTAKPTPTPDELHEAITGKKPEDDKKAAPEPASTTRTTEVSRTGRAS